MTTRSESSESDCGGSTVTPGEVLSRLDLMNHQRLQLALGMQDELMRLEEMNMKRLRLARQMQSELLALEQQQQDAVRRTGSPSVRTGAEQPRDPAVPPPAHQASPYPAEPSMALWDYQSQTRPAARPDGDDGGGPSTGNGLAADGQRPHEAAAAAATAAKQQMDKELRREWAHLWCFEARRMLCEQEKQRRALTAEVNQAAGARPVLQQRLRSRLDEFEKLRARNQLRLDMARYEEAATCAAGEGGAAPLLCGGPAVAAAADQQQMEALRLEWAEQWQHQAWVMFNEGLTERRLLLDKIERAAAAAAAGVDPAGWRRLQGQLAQLETREAKNELRLVGAWGDLVARKRNASGGGGGGGGPVAQPPQQPPAVLGPLHRRPSPCHSMRTIWRAGQGDVRQAAASGGTDDGGVGPATQPQPDLSRVLPLPTNKRPRLEDGAEDGREAPAGGS